MRLWVFLRKLKTALSLTPLQWKTLLAAYYLLLKARLLVLASPQKTVEKALIKNPPQKFQPSGLSKKELLDLFRLAWRYQITKPNCLPTSLALRAYLLCYGFPTEIRIGVQRKHEGLKAHAWLETPEGSTVGEFKWDLYDPLHSLENGEKPREVPL